MFIDEGVWHCWFLIDLPTFPGGWHAARELLSDLPELQFEEGTDVDVKAIGTVTGCFFIDQGESLSVDTANDLAGLSHL